jgi:hypothetical protein
MNLFMVVINLCVIKLNEIEICRKTCRAKEPGKQSPLILISFENECLLGGMTPCCPVERYEWSRGVCPSIFR